MLKYHCDRFGPKPPDVGTIIDMPRELPRPISPFEYVRGRHARYMVVAYPATELAHCTIIQRLCDRQTTTVATHYLTCILEHAWSSL